MIDGYTLAQQAIERCAVEGENVDGSFVLDALCALNSDHSMTMAQRNSVIQDVISAYDHALNGE